eukprot:TRINITY_DN1545_c0_g1_i1.p2 TRINITY_DN1545_c0_g1~~TRINITY_DN1545_c0_g1_i1.p2  ORF type:complete len:175 (+),score=15.53 TRINITY_DN1545_c0_g1_i1:221-745(+)
MKNKNYSRFVGIGSLPGDFPVSNVSGKGFGKQTVPPDLEGEEKLYTEGESVKAGVKESHLSEKGQELNVPKKNDQTIENYFDIQSSNLFNATMNAGVQSLKKSRNFPAFENWTELLMLMQKILDLIAKNPTLAWEELAQSWLEKEDLKRADLQGCSTSSQNLTIFLQHIYVFDL